jgi:hypothetical protein
MSLKVILNSYNMLVAMAFNVLELQWKNTIITFDCHKMHIFTVNIPIFYSRYRK